MAKKQKTTKKLSKFTCSVFLWCVLVLMIPFNLVFIPLDYYKIVSFLDTLSRGSLDFRFSVGGMVFRYPDFCKQVIFIGLLILALRFTISFIGFVFGFLRTKLALRTVFSYKSIFSKKPSEKPTADWHSMTGIEFEEYVANRLRYEGYTNVRTTQASGDYGVDILGVFKGRKIAVQCKLYHSSVGVHAVQEVEAGRLFYGCDKAMVITNSYFTPNAKKMASRLGVILVEYYE